MSCILDLLELIIIPCIVYQEYTLIDCYRDRTRTCLCTVVQIFIRFIIHMTCTNLNKNRMICIYISIIIIYDYHNYSIIIARTYQRL